MISAPAAGYMCYTLKFLAPAAGSMYYHFIFCLSPAVGYMCYTLKFWRLRATFISHKVFLAPGYCITDQFRQRKILRARRARSARSARPKKLFEHGGREAPGVRDRKKLCGGSGGRSPPAPKAESPPQAPLGLSAVALCFNPL